MQAPAIAVANCGQLIINNTPFAVPFKIEFAKIIPTDKIKIYFTNAAGIAPNQKFLLACPERSRREKIKTINAFPVIINGIIGAKVNGKSPVYKDIKLGTKHKKKADSKLKTDAEINNNALTIEPVIN